MSIPPWANNFVRDKGLATRPMHPPVHCAPHIEIWARLCSPRLHGWPINWGQGGNLSQIGKIKRISLAPNSLFGDFWRLGPQPAQAKNHGKRAVCKPTHGPSKLPHYQKSITTNIVGKDFCPVNGLLGLGAAP